MRHWTANGIALLAIASCLGIASGCGGGSTGSVTPPPPPPAGPASGSEFLYAFSNENGGEIYVSSLDTSTGRLTEHDNVMPANLPAALAEQWPPVTVGKYLYAPGFDNPHHSDGIYAFSITGANGQLTALGTDRGLFPLDFAGDANITGFVVDGLGHYIYASFNPLNQFQIQFLPIDQSNGAIIQGSIFTEPNFFGSLSLQAADPAGKFLYAWALGPKGPQICVYSINSGTGTIGEVPGSPFLVSSTSSTGHLFVSPSGKFLYLTGTAIDQSSVTRPALFIFAVDPNSGALAQTAKSPIILPKADINLPAVLSPSGNLIYIAEHYEDGGGNVNTDFAVFQVNQSDGSIGATAASTIPQNSNSVLPDPSGKVLLVGPGGSNSQTFWTYLVNDSTGVLTAAQGSPFFANDPNTLEQFFTVARIP